MTTPSTPDTPTGALARLAARCALHPWRTLVAWAAAFVLVVGSASAFGGKLVNEYVIKGSDSQAAVDLLEERFPEQSGEFAQIVFTSDDGMTDAQSREAVAAARKTAADVPGVIGVGDPYTGTGGAVSADGEVAFVNVQFDKPASEVTAEDKALLEDGVRTAVGDGSTTVEFGGPVMSQVEADSRTSEMLGIGAAMIVLLIVFGSAVAMAVPITLAVVSVGIGLSLLTLGAALTSFNSITPILATMIGLGVGIDYALFIVTRFRQGLADGLSPVQAATTATATAGRAVLFAGATVAISISGLAVVGLDFVTKMGLGAALAVAVSVATAVTLLPAVLAKLGHRITSGRVPFLPKRDDSAEARRRSGSAKLGRFVARHPKAVLAATLTTLIVLALPVAAIDLGSADSGSMVESRTQRKAYDDLVEGFGPGFNGPFRVVVDQNGDEDAAVEVAKAIQSTPGVATVTEPVYNEAGDTAIVNVVPTTSPQSAETSDLLTTLRTETIPAALEGSSAQAYVGGQTAAYEDMATTILDRLPMFLLLVVGVIGLILTMAFRSIVVAIKAALTTLLSGLAALGILVAVLQWGWGIEQIGLDRTGPIESYLPLIVFSILYGLSMDYEVFLVSRIREEFVKGRSARDAIVEGQGAIGRIIVAAAAIMGVVFFAFVLSEDRGVKAFGLGLGAAILIDALIVRMLLVPAVMHLLGDKAWYIPRWLDRLLPQLTIEAPDEADSDITDEDEVEVEPLPRAA